MTTSPTLISLQSASSQRFSPGGRAPWFLSKSTLRLCRWGGVGLILLTLWLTQDTLKAKVWGPELVALGAAVYLFGSTERARPRSFGVLRIPQLFDRFSYLRGLPLSHVLPGWNRADLAYSPSKSKQCDQIRYFPDGSVLAVLGNPFHSDQRCLTTSRVCNVSPTTAAYDLLSNLSKDARKPRTFRSVKIC